jgi:hypothetical protein
MKTMKLILMVGFFSLASIQNTFSQEYKSDSLIVPFSEPARPKHLKANIIMGSIIVRGYDGKDALIDQGRP